MRKKPKNPHCEKSSQLGIMGKSGRRMVTTASVFLLLLLLLLLLGWCEIQWRLVVDIFNWRIGMVISFFFFLFSFFFLFWRKEMEL